MAGSATATKKTSKRQTARKPLRKKTTPTQTLMKGVLGEHGVRMAELSGRIAGRRNEMTRLKEKNAEDVDSLLIVMKKAKRGKWIHSGIEANITKGAEKLSIKDVK